MPDVKRSSAKAPSTVIVRSIALTQATLQSLEALAAGMPSKSRRKTSVSAVVRALLRHAQEVPDIANKLSALIEQEQSHDVVWGKPPRSD